MSVRANGSRLWNIRGPAIDILFIGTLQEMVIQLSKMNQFFGVPHAAIEVK
jgi:hypothetical protein